MRTAKRLAHLPRLLVCKRCRLKILVNRVELLGLRLDAVSWPCRPCFVLGLKFVRFPRIRPRGRIVEGIIHHRLLEIKFRAAKPAKVSFRSIEFSAVLARIHIDPANRLRSLTNNSKQMFDYRFQRWARSSNNLQPFSLPSRLKIG